MNKSIFIKDTPETCTVCPSFRAGFCKELKEQLEYEEFITKSERCPVQDTTELLEALEEVKEVAEFYQRNINNSLMVNIGDKLLIKYNKLYKALGGE